MPIDSKPQLRDWPLLRAPGVTAEDVAERIIGRRRSGEPLVDSAPDPDTFSFAGTHASRCPYQAHIRVMNPRDGGPDPIIIRRGMAYDQGLMFVSLHRTLMDFTSLMFRAEFARDPILSTTADWTVDSHPSERMCCGTATRSEVGDQRTDRLLSGRELDHDSRRRVLLHPQPHIPASLFKFQARLRPSAPRAAIDRSSGRIPLRSVDSRPSEPEVCLPKQR